MFELCCKIGCLLYTAMPVGWAEQHERLVDACIGLWVGCVTGRAATAAELVEFRKRFPTERRFVSFEGV